MKIPAIFLLVAQTAVFASLPPGVEQTLKAHLDERIDRELNQSIIVGVVTQSSEDYITAGTLRDGDSTVPDKNTIFEIGGVTKVLTAAAASDLVMERQLTWKTPAAALLPQEAHPPIFDGQYINLHQLATHSTGLPPLPLDLKPADPRVPLADFDKAALYKALPQTGYAFRPGTSYVYSDLGYGLLGHLLELRTDQTYDAIIQEHIAGPLKMSDTFVEFTGERLDRLAPPHDGVGETKLWDWGALQAAGELKSTAADLITYLKAQMGMFKNPKAKAFAVTHVPVIPSGAKDTMAGYAWQITSRSGTTVYWHNGQTGGYAAFIGFNPGRRIGVAVLSNTSQSIDEIGFYLLAPDVFPLGEFPPLRVIPTVTLERYVGTYEVTPDHDVVITRDGGKLYAQLPGTSKYRIYPITLTRFGFAKGNITLNFENKGGKGPVQVLTVEEKFSSYPARRKR